VKQLPNWLILSEIKSEEVKCFLESIRTGACGMTTMLAEDVRSIPERILAMAGEKEDSRWIENDTYRYLDIGILVKSKRDEHNHPVRSFSSPYRFPFKHTNLVNKAVQKSCLIPFTFH